MLVGAHVSSSGGLDKAIERGEQIGAESIQIFNQSPRMWRPTAYSDNDFATFRERLADSPVESVFIHAVYLINVASVDAEVRKKSLASLTHALRVGDGIDAGGVILHPGSRKGRDLDETLEAIGKACQQALGDSDSCPLLFENTAGAGDTIGRNFSELGRLIELTGGGDRVGVCIDSCHMLASGYEIRTPAGCKKAMSEAKRDMGAKRIKVLHLNDSKMPLGSNRDRHENLGDGEIGEQGIVCFLSDKSFKTLPVLLEVPGPEKKGPDANQVQIAKRLRDQAIKG
jgi:deoxyribonuclease-4